MLRPSIALLTASELGLLQEPPMVKDPVGPGPLALVRRSSPLLQFGDMEPLLTSLSLPLLIHKDRSTPRSETPVAPSTEMEATSACANAISTQASPRKDSPNVSRPANTVSPVLPAPTLEHGACIPYQTAGCHTPLTKLAIKPTRVPRVPPRPNPKPAQPKITSFYKCKPLVPHIPLKPAILQHTKTSIRVPQSALHHPPQVSSEAAKVFSFKSQPPPSSKPVSKLVQPKPITCFRSYKAYEAACVSPVQEKPCPPESPPMWLGEHLQHSVSDFHDGSELEKTCPNGVLDPDAEACSTFVAARLPTFSRTTSPHPVNTPDLVDIFKSASDSPVIGALFDLPSPRNEPAIPPVVNKWAEERSLEYKTGCNVHRNKPRPMLEDSGFDLAMFWNLNREEDAEAKAMTNLCAAMDALVLEKEQRGIDITKLDADFGSYGFEYADLNDDWDFDHTASSRWDDLLDPPILIDHEETWEGDEWTMLTSSLVSSDRSDFETSSEFDFNLDDCDPKPASADFCSSDINSALKEALCIPLPSSTSTESLVSEDTGHVMKIFSERHEGFVELVGMEWGNEDDEFSVSLDAWNDGRFKGEQDQNPFNTFPIVDGEAMGEGGMVL